MSSAASGIVVAALSPAVMPFLSTAQREAGRELGRASGVVLNATLGRSGADPIAALVIAAAFRAPR